MYIYACHGYLRKNFIAFANFLGTPISSLIIALIYLFFALMFSLIIMQIEKQIRNWLSQTQDKKSSDKRVLLLIFSVILIFGTIYGYNQNMIREEKSTKNQIIFTSINDFENNDSSDSRFTDTIYFSGRKCVVMIPNESYSPAMEVEFNKINLDKICRAEGNVMLYTVDSLARAIFVLEILDIENNITMEYKTKELTNEEFIKGKWQQLKFEYFIPKFFRSPKYKIRIYLWNNSKGQYFADDLKLTILSYD
jgi:hypothetical protein